MTQMYRNWPLLGTTGLLVAVGAGCSTDVLLARADGAGGTSQLGSPSTGGGAGSAAEVGGEGSSTEPVRLLADSVADFSFTQGEHGWYYGYDSGSLDTFTLLTRTSVITLFTPPSNQRWDCWASDTAHWTQIFQLGAHPNGTSSSTPSSSILQRAVRRWVSTIEGDVVIKGELAKLDLLPDAGTNGVDASIYVDGVQRFNDFIAADDGAGFSYEIAASVDVGSNIDFVLDPHEGDDHHDLTRFTGVIVRDGG